MCKNIGEKSKLTYPFQIIYNENVDFPDIFPVLQFCYLCNLCTLLQFC